MPLPIQSSSKSRRSLHAPGMRITMPGRKENATEKRKHMTLDHDDQDEELTWLSLPRVTRSQIKRSHNLSKSILKTMFQQLANMKRQCFDKLQFLKQFYNTYCKQILKQFLLLICIISGKSGFQFAYVAESFLFVTLSLHLQDVNIFCASKCNCRLKVDS